MDRRGIGVEGGPLAANTERIVIGGIGATFAAGRPDALAALLGADVLHRMARLRYEAFHDRLGWIAATSTGEDWDAYDALPPWYGLCLLDDGFLAGTWRILPSLGPTMLADLFPALLHGAPAPADAATWEISRFALSRERGGGVALAAAAVLLRGLFRHGQRCGIARFAACSDTRFQRLLERAGVQLALFGPPVRIGATEAVGGYADVASQADRLIGMAWATGTRAAA
ncbi:MAG TPA: acyl-homoserine-lactone synthase [Alphaproteobacteria bacterium]|nr:acyl-homoserine-lactone synthase [Alphaproteobacteria bacterium]